MKNEHPRSFLEQDDIVIHDYEGIAVIELQFYFLKQ